MFAMPSTAGSYKLLFYPIKCCRKRRKSWYRASRNGRLYTSGVALLRFFRGSAGNVWDFAPDIRLKLPSTEEAAVYLALHERELTYWDESWMAFGDTAILEISGSVGERLLFPDFRVEAVAVHAEVEGRAAKAQQTG